MGQRNEFGWCRMQDVEIDYLVKSIPINSSILEVGTWHGATACTILNNRPDIRKWVSIDNLSGGVGNSQYAEGDLIQLMNNVCNTDNFHLFIGDSEIFCEFCELSSFDIVIIDGDHSYECTISDLRNVERLCNLTSRLIVHDYHSELEELSGVSKAADDFFNYSNGANFSWNVEKDVGLSRIYKRY